LTQLAGTGACIALSLSGCGTGLGLSEPLNITATADGLDAYVVGGNNQGQGAGSVAVLNWAH
jgi:hypothetical protein